MTDDEIKLLFVLLFYAFTISAMLEPYAKSSFRTNKIKEQADEGELAIDETDTIIRHFHRDLAA